MDLHVARLTVRVSRLSTAEGRRLAELVGSRLAKVAPGGEDRDELRITIDAAAGEPLETMADRIAAALGSSLGRSK